MNLGDLNTARYGEAGSLYSHPYIPLADRVDTLEMENSALRDRIDEIENRIALYNLKASHRI